MRRLIALMLIMYSSSSTVFAGAGHDHGHDHAEEASSMPNANRPQRLPDGSVFLPKTSQRFINIRTLQVKQEDLPKTKRLNGQVIANTDAIGKLYALQSGRLTFTEPLPKIGDQLKAGQKLAKITVVSDALEKTNQAVEVANLREQLKLAEKEYKRLSGLGNLIPRRETDVALSNVRSLKARLTSFKQGKTSEDILTAPLSGIVTAISMTNKQAVQAGDVLLEMINPDKLLVEALSFDLDLLDNISAATLQLDNQTIPLTYQNTVRRLRQQALPLRFSIAKDKIMHLADGLPVQVIVQTKETLKGVALPAKALAHNVSNQDIVWVKTAPEHYQPQVVRYEPLDGQRIMVTAGLQGDERVVVQATTLINQIR